MLKKHIALSVGVAIFGTLIAFFVCNLFFGEIKDKSFKTIEGSGVNADLSEPDPEVFNFRAINPTVEVYVGEER